MIGADNYQDAALSISAAKNDVKNLARTLESIEYSLEASLISSDGFLITKASLRSRIGDFVEKACPNQHLLIYFTGHGIEQDAQRLLVSQDYDRSRPPHSEELVSESDLYSWARLSPAKSIVFVLDACREGVRLVLAQDKVIEKSPPAYISDKQYDSPTVGIVYSCSTLQTSWASKGEAGYSFFTRALCDALEEDPDAATVEELLGVTQCRLTDLLNESGITRKQTIVLDERPIQGRAGSLHRLVLRESPVAEYRHEIEQSPWCKEVTRSTFWQDIQSTSIELADRILAIVMHCEMETRQVSRQVPDDHWRDIHAPSQIIQLLERLMKESKVRLTPAEAALLLIVPYLYEGVLAAGTYFLTEDGDPIDPFSQEVDSSASYLWFAWRNKWSSDEQQLKRHSLLCARQKETEASDLIAWHLNRFLHSANELWTYPYSLTKGSEAETKPCIDITRLFCKAPIPTSIDERVEELLDGKRLVRFARLMFSSWQDIENVRLNDTRHPLSNDERIGSPPGEWSLNEPLVAHLLSITAAMILDARRLDNVIADHLGMTSGFNAKAVSHAIREGAWHLDGERIIFKLVCWHEALDVAVRSQVESIDAHRRRLETEIEGVDRIRSILPAHFSDAWVRAAPREDGEPSYKLPHLQLTLDQRRVFQLLMGKSLYKDQALALRELYQNALDACRLRRARVLYAQTVTPERRIDYDGHISFGLGVDESGRRFVECKDNGIGMGERQLHTLFAKAGQRFTDTHEFHVEKAEWTANGVEFFENSRFGIGVFSYFMLADELVVETRRLSLNAIDMEPGIRATLAGGSSLFRTEPAVGLSAGTTVRLYLRDGEEFYNLLESVRKWLWIPEFDMTLTDHSGETKEFIAGRLIQDSSRFQSQEPIPIPASTEQNSPPSIFWNQSLYSKSTILADGIHTEDASDAPVRRLIVNLRGELQPELSVDRSRITSWTKGYKYLTDCLRASDCKELLYIEHARLESLSDSFATWPLPLVILDRTWRQGLLVDSVEHSDKAVAKRDSKRDRSSLDLSSVKNEILSCLLKSRVGISPILDKLLMGPTMNRQSDDNESDGYIPTKIEDVHCVAFGQWVAARAHALCAAGWNAPTPIRDLASFAASKKWIDRPSIGLLLLDSGIVGVGPNKSISLFQILRAADTWSLTHEEMKYVLQPLLTLGITMPDLNTLPDSASLSPQVRRALSEAVNQSGVETSSFDLLAAMVKSAVPTNEVSRLLTPFSVLGVPIPLIDWWATLPPLSSSNTSVLAEVLQSANNKSDLKMAIIDVCTKFEKATILDVTKYLDPDDALTKTVEHAINSESVRSAVSRYRDGLGPWLKQMEASNIVELALQLQLSIGRTIELTRHLREIGLISGRGTVDLDVSHLHEDSTCFLTRRSRRVTLELLFTYAYQHQVSLGEALARAKPLESLGVSVPTLGHDEQELLVHSQYIMLLDRNLDEAERRVDLESDIPISRLLIASAEWNVPLENVLNKARQLSKLGVSIPGIDRIPPDFAISVFQLNALSEELDGQAPWLDYVSLGHLIAAAQLFELSFEQLCAEAKQLEEFGVADCLSPSWIDWYQSSEALELLSKDLDGKYPWIDEVTPLQVLRLCVRWSKSWDTVLSFAGQLGVLPKEFPALGVLKEFEPSNRHLEALSRDLSRERFDVFEPSIGHLLLLSNRWTMTLSAVFEFLRPLEQIGIVGLPRIEHGDLQVPMSERHLLLVSKDLDGLPDWKDSLELSHLQRAARSFGWPLSRVLDTALNLRKLGLTMPPIPEVNEQVWQQSMEVLDALRPGQTTLQPWELAFVAAQQDADVKQYAHSLEVVRAVGVDVEEAEHFVRFLGVS